jgi:hypothetical protein
VSRFTGFLDLELVENADGDPLTRNGRCIWRLTRPLSYDVGAEGSGETITIPAGFITDLASIPAFAWPVFPADGPYAKAAVVHDYGYSVAGVMPDGRRYSRRQIDDIFREAMAVVGVSRWRRMVIYAAVRVGGRPGWGAPP